MQPDIMQKFRDENPNKFSAENERRIKWTWEIKKE
jgi:hypothetical protein